MFQSSGSLHYSVNPYRLVVNADDELARYYRSLVPKYLKIKKPLFPAHISVVRNCVPPKLDSWGKYENIIINFFYENYIYNDELYFWLNIYSSELENIRAELGLSPWGDVTLSPDFKHRFHLTLGNLK